MNNLNMRRVLKQPTLRAADGVAPAGSDWANTNSQLANIQKMNAGTTADQSATRAMTPEEQAAQQAGKAARQSLVGSGIGGSQMAVGGVTQSGPINFANLRNGGEIRAEGGFSLPSFRDIGRGVSNAVTAVMPKPETPEEGQARRAAKYAVPAAQPHQVQQTQQTGQAAPPKEITNYQTGSNAARMGSEYIPPTVIKQKHGGDLRTGHGGDVPGTGHGDKIPAKYEPGEFVVSNDMLDAKPSLRKELRALRKHVLAKKGMTPEMADAKALGQKPGQLRAEEGLTYGPGVIHPYELDLKNATVAGPQPLPAATVTANNVAAARQAARDAVDPVKMNQPGVDSRNAQLRERDAWGKPSVQAPIGSPSADQFAQEIQSRTARQARAAARAAPQTNAPTITAPNNGWGAPLNFEGAPMGSPKTAPVAPSGEFLDPKLAVPEPTPTGVIGKTSAIASKVMGGVKTAVTSPYTGGKALINGVAQGAADAKEFIKTNPVQAAGVGLTALGAAPGQLRVGEVLARDNQGATLDPRTWNLGNTTKQQLRELRHFAAQGVGGAIGFAGGAAAAIPAAASVIGAPAAPFLPYAGMVAGAAAGGKFDDMFDPTTTLNADPVHGGSGAGSAEFARNDPRRTDMNGGRGGVNTYADREQNHSTTPAPDAPKTTTGSDGRQYLDGVVSSADRLSADRDIHAAFGNRNADEDYAARVSRLRDGTASKDDWFIPPGGGVMAQTNGNLNLKRLGNASETELRDKYNAALARKGAGIRVDAQANGTPIFSNSTSPEKMQYTDMKGNPTSEYRNTQQYADGMVERSKLLAEGAAVDKRAMEYDARVRAHQAANPDTSQADADHRRAVQAAETKASIKTDPARATQGAAELAALNRAGETTATARATNRQQAISAEALRVANNATLEANAQQHRESNQVLREGHRMDYDAKMAPVILAQKNQELIRQVMGHNSVGGNLTKAARALLEMGRGDLAKTLHEQITSEQAAATSSENLASSQAKNMREQFKGQFAHLPKEEADAAEALASQTLDKLNSGEIVGAGKNHDMKQQAILHTKALLGMQQKAKLRNNGWWNTLGGQDSMPTSIQGSAAPEQAGVFGWNGGLRKGHNFEAGDYNYGDQELPANVGDDVISYLRQYNEAHTKAKTKAK